jgi:hypothetical protein
MEIRRAWLLGLPLPLWAIGVAPPAAAHEARAEGGFSFVVGWGEEPTYTGFKNSVQVTVSEGGSPVNDLVGSLKIEVIKGEDTITLPLVASGTPGDYRAWLTPTRPGSYTFRLVGTVRSRTVDESFTSSSTTFNDVEDAAGIQFPAKDPSGGQLATRIDREFPRIASRMDALEDRLRDANDRAGAARVLALFGAAAGVMGLVAAAAGRRTSSRRRPRLAGGSRAPAEQTGSRSR